MPSRLLALLAAVVLVAAACGDSGSDDGTGDTEDAPESGATAVTIKATDFAFDQTDISADAGATVEIELVNGGNVTHSFTARDLDVDIEADTGGTAAASVTMPEDDATIEYVCRFHPQDMNGTITVGAGSGAGAGGGGSEDEPAGESEDYDY